MKSFKVPANPNNSMILKRFGNLRLGTQVQNNFTSESRSLTLVLMISGSGSKSNGVRTMSRNLR